MRRVMMKSSGRGDLCLRLKERGPDSDATPADMLVVQHWAEELEARVP
jgi:hypothetical protein